MKRFPLFILVFLLTACAKPVTNTPTIISSSATVSPEATVTLSPSPTQPSPTAKATVDPLAWQTTADGKIMWQAAGLELFGRDQFTVNEELSGKLYKEVLLKMVYAVNRAGDPDGFAKQYSAFVSFAKYVAEHPGTTYDDLLRLDQHPDADGGKKSAVYAEWQPAGGNVSLDNFVVRAVDRETAMTEEFVTLDGYAGFMMDTVNVDGKTVFRFSFSSLLMGDDPGFNLTDLSAENDPAENLRTLTLVLNLFESLAEKKSLASLDRGGGVILYGWEPMTMDLTQPGSSVEARIDRFEQWASGDQYLLLVGEEMGQADEWDLRLVLSTVELDGIRIDGGDEQARVVAESHNFWYD